MKYFVLLLVLTSCGLTSPHGRPSAFPAKPDVQPVSVPASHGADSSGGGYAFSETSDVLLNRAIEQAEWDIEHYPEDCVNKHLAQKYGYKPINEKEMLRLVKEIRRDYFKEASRTNEDGKLEPLMFDWGKDESGQGYIVALRLFFVANAAYNPEKPTSTSLKLAEKQLLHETVHLFGYGEKEARKFVAIFLGTGIWNDCADKNRED